LATRIAADISQGQLDVLAAQIRQARLDAGGPSSPAPAVPASLARPAANRLAAEFRQAMLDAGGPSYRAIVRRSGSSFSASTITRMLNAASVPGWETVTVFLRALGVSPAAIREKWLPLWQDAHSERDRQGNTATAATPPGNGAAVECGACGALVANSDRHQAWHWRVEQQASRTPLRAVEG
jgi:hypothetical protein